MAKYVLTGVLALQTPNVKQVASQIRQQLKGLDATVNLKISPASLTALKALNDQLAQLKGNLSRVGDSASALNNIGDSVGKLNTAIATNNRALSNQQASSTELLEVSRPLILNWKFSVPKPL